MERGRRAISTLAEYRKLKAADANDKRLPELAEQLKLDMPYFGYGYIKDCAELVPYIPVNFYAFRVMVGVGTLLMLPLTYLASEAGWIVAELGRQPWAIQDMLPTVAAVSDLKSGSVAFTFFLFLVLFTVLLVAEVSIMCRVIRNYNAEKQQ